MTPHLPVSVGTIPEKEFTTKLLLNMYQHQCLSVTQTEVASSNTVGVILKPAALKIFMESRDAMYGDDIVAIKVNGVEKEVEDMALFIMNRKVGQEIMVTVQPA